MNRRFPLLSIVSIIMRYIGWIQLAPGLFLSLLMVIDLFTERGAGITPLDLFRAVFLVTSGLVLVASGESIGVFFAIEANTRAAADRLSKTTTTSHSKT